MLNPRSGLRSRPSEASGSFAMAGRCSLARLGFAFLRFFCPRGNERTGEERGWSSLRRMRHHAAGLRQGFGTTKCRLRLRRRSGLKYDLFSSLSGLKVFPTSEG
jgi:hypothetical protein